MVIGIGPWFLLKKLVLVIVIFLQDGNAKTNTLDDEKDDTYGDKDDAGDYDAMPIRKKSRFFFILNGSYDEHSEATKEEENYEVQKTQFAVKAFVSVTLYACKKKGSETWAGPRNYSTII